MYIYYKNKKLRKVCEGKITLSKVKTISKPVIEQLFFLRLDQLAAFESLKDVPNTPPFRRHKLTGKLEGAWAVDIKEVNRICFIPYGEFEKDANGNAILETVKAVEIIFIGDYHDG